MEAVVKPLKVIAGILVGLAVSAVGAWLASLLAAAGDTMAWIAAGFVFLMGLAAGVMAGLFIGAEKADPLVRVPPAGKPDDTANGSDGLDAKVAVGLAVATTTHEEEDSDDGGAADIED